jgi:HEAT repeat protein
MPAAFVLVRLGPNVRGLAPELTRMLEATGPDAWYRPIAATLLGRISSGARDAVPALARATRDEDLHLRFAAVRSLGQIGPAADRAAPELIKLIDEQGQPRRLRCRAALALWQIRPNAPEVVPALAMVLRRGAAEHQEAALDAIQQLGPQAEGAVPVLSDMLEAGTLEGAAVTQVLRTLRQIGRNAQTASPAILPLLEHDDWQVRLGAARALWEIDRHPSVVPALIKMLGEENVFAQEGVAEVLGEIGPAGQEAADALLPLVAEGRPAHLRIAAAYALWETARHESAIPVLVALLASEDPNTRDNAARTLARIGPPAEEALPVLERLEKTVPADAVGQAIRAIRGEVLPDEG